MSALGLSSSAPAAGTLRVLAALLSYPDAHRRGQLSEMAKILRCERALPGSRLAELEALIERLGGNDPLDVEADYVHLFDRGRATSLHLFEHVHGDSRDRGPAMVDLVKHYEAAGLFFDGKELPDHLCVVLEFASTQPPAQAREFLGEVAHILQALFTALRQRESAYASLVAGVLELAGQKAEAVPVTPDEALDASWEEPQAFGGCSTQGQAAPGQPQPIQIVRRPGAAQGART